MKPTIDIVIPSFDGKHLLEKNLPKVIKNSDFLHKIIVVDNGSTDGTVEWLKENYPDIIIIKNQTNLGFTKPINQGVAASTSEYFVLLNNDVRPLPDYLKKAMRYFDNEKVFAVTFNEADSSWPLVTWEKGKIQFKRGEDKSLPRYSAWASGGSALFRRSIWDKIGGFNEIYAPFYWEDIDIGFRAWKMGYQIIWDNQSNVIHHHESTANRLNQSKVSLIKQRNELLFNWINITDKKLLASHMMFLLTYTLSHPGYLRVVLSAVVRFVIKRGRKIKYKLSDSEVLSLVNKPYAD